MSYCKNSLKKKPENSMLISVEGTPRSQNSFLYDSLYELEQGMPGIGSTYHARFNCAEPFPHIVFEGLFDPLILKVASKNFPNLDKSNHGAKRYSGLTMSKLESNYPPYLYPLSIRYLCQFFSSPGFLQFLQLLTGFNELLIPDPSLLGGGLTQLNRNGFIKLHNELNLHPKNHLDRRVNVILYLNEFWGDNWGGYVELWDEKMNKKIKRSYKPLINRLLILPNNDYTFYGTPDPLKCPANIFSKSLTLFFYSNGRPKVELKKNREVNQITYKERPGEIFKDRIKF